MALSFELQARVTTPLPEAHRDGNGRLLPSICFGLCFATEGHGAHSEPYFLVPKPDLMMGTSWTKKRLAGVGIRTSGPENMCRPTQSSGEEVLQG